MTTFHQAGHTFNNSLVRKLDCKNFDFLLPVEWQIASVVLPVFVVAEQLECVLVEFVVAAVLIEQLGAVRLLELVLLLGLEPD